MNEREELLRETLAVYDERLRQINREAATLRRWRCEAQMELNEVELQRITGRAA